MKIEDIENALAAMDNAADTQEQPNSESASAWIQALGNALNSPGTAAPTGGHADLDTLRQWARERRRRGADWQMPEHLGTCPLCLELFSILVEDDVSLPAASRKRFMELWDGHGGNTGGFARFAWRAAAVLAVAVGIGVIIHVRSRPGVTVDTAALQEPPRVTVSGATELHTATAREQHWVHASLPDESSIDMGSDTLLRIKRSMRGSQLVELDHGRIRLDIKPQPHGFRVKTSLGEITVIGTRFEVFCGNEPVTVYRSGKGEESEAEQETIATVRVSVTSGTVTVNNRHEQCLVHKGQTAVLRAGHPRIETGPIE